MGDMRERERGSEMSVRKQSEAHVGCMQCVPICNFMLRSSSTPPMQSVRVNGSILKVKRYK